jgi:hypothetical protein
MECFPAAVTPQVLLAVRNSLQVAVERIERRSALFAVEASIARRRLRVTLSTPIAATSAPGGLPSDNVSAPRRRG